MSNRSHQNRAHIAINVRRKRSVAKLPIELDDPVPHNPTHHAVVVADCLDVLRSIPSGSVSLVFCDPPYNIRLAAWDVHPNYADWAVQWLAEVERVLLPKGNFVLFGGFQFQGEGGSGDLLSLMSLIRARSCLRLVNVIVWAYPNGMSAHRFFASRHEEMVWMAKTKDYHFDLDSVREPYNPIVKAAYLKDPRLRSDTVEKGRNPTNVWRIPRLSANSKERVGHPTQKPLALVRRVIRALSWPGSTVLDFFAGSGVTTRACIEEGRSSVSCDQDSSLFSYFERHVAQGDWAATAPAFRIHHDLHEHPLIKQGVSATR